MDPRPSGDVRELDHAEANIALIGGLSESDPAICHDCGGQMIAADTPRQVVMRVSPQHLNEQGLWDKACEVLGLNPWALNEGRMSSDEMLPLNRDQARALFGRK